jgi:hypothetical protein
LATSLSAQGSRSAPPDSKQILGRWIGSVTADVGEMSIGIELKETDGKIAGTIETPHGNWAVDSVTAREGRWTLHVKTEDGGEGRLVGQVKDGRFAGDWDFKPRAVGTFEVTRPAKQ